MRHWTQRVGQRSGTHLHVQPDGSCHRRDSETRCPSVPSSARSDFRSHPVPQKSNGTANRIASYMQPPPRAPYTARRRIGPSTDHRAHCSEVDTHASGCVAQLKKQEVKPSRPNSSRRLERTTRSSSAPYPIDSGPYAGQNSAAKESTITGGEPLLYEKRLKHIPYRDVAPANFMFVSQDVFPRGSNIAQHIPLRDDPPIPLGDERKQESCAEPSKAMDLQQEHALEIMEILSKLECAPSVLQAELRSVVPDFPAPLPMLERILLSLRDTEIEDARRQEVIRKRREVAQWRLAQRIRERKRLEERTRTHSPCSVLEGNACFKAVLNHDDYTQHIEPRPPCDQGHSSAFRDQRLEYLRRQRARRQKLEKYVGTYYSTLQEYIANADTELVHCTDAKIAKRLLSSRSEHTIQKPRSLDSGPWTSLNLHRVAQHRRRWDPDYLRRLRHVENDLQIEREAEKDVTDMAHGLVQPAIAKRKLFSHLPPCVRSAAEVTRMKLGCCRDVMYEADVIDLHTLRSKQA